jgi:hypothetical protein
MIQNQGFQTTPWQLCVDASNSTAFQWEADDINDAPLAQT